MEADTPGKRVYLIRLALGDGLRSPLSMEEFAALITERTGVAYNSSTISKIENGGRRVTLEDVGRIAVVDPRQRGREWLGWGDEPLRYEPGVLTGIDRRTHPDPDAAHERGRAEGE